MVWQLRVFTEFIKSEFLGQNQSGVSSLLLFFPNHIYCGILLSLEKKLAEVFERQFGKSIKNRAM